MKKILIILAALAMLALGAGTAAADEAAVLGQPFPAFTATDTEGNTFTLSGALKDHEAVLVNIWATWCPPCRSEMPHLNEAYEKYADRVAFIALSCEDGDTMEKIGSFRQEYGLNFPMGRDEGGSLSAYLSTGGIPVTVVVDRFGNAAFMQTGCFFSADEVSRVIESFLGDSYTETSVLTEIPKDTATRAFPAAAASAVRVENADARPFVLRVEGEPEPLQGYVVSDGSARLRLEAAADSNPADMICYDYRTGSYLDLPGLLDPQRGAFVYEAAMPGPEAEEHFTYVCLLDYDGRICADVYLAGGEEYIEELADAIRSSGYTVTWEYSEPVPAEEAAQQAYILHVTDQNGEPVPGMAVNFCTDTACTMRQSDGSGTITFEGAPDTYHVQLLKAPEGYSFDPDFEMYTGNTYGEWVLRIRKN